MKPSAWNEGLESPPNPQTRMSALHVARVFQPAGPGDFPVACSRKLPRLNGAGTLQRDVSTY